MLSILSNATLNNEPQKRSTIPVVRIITNIGITMAIVASTLSITGCSTTQEFKPTASVIVGAHKSL